MQPYYALLISIALIAFVLYNESYKRKLIISRYIKAKKMKGENLMKELAKKFIGKECIINTINSELLGTVKEVDDGAILIDNKGNPELINLDLIVRLREHPKNKKGKNKVITG